eukprot:CAMPEP_0184235568 /NCGR_PEP_ID=MMETSP0976-20121227/25385_1 /TAXON_ID=483370 /ORGANISM="non described non described, Strain CCMP2097" /LENGTH=32 /DNA_ID= /DNA_START= /DNA_END= /DNA_ORIENTATION=
MTRCSSSETAAHPARSVAMSGPGVAQRSWCPG